MKKLKEVEEALYELATGYFYDEITNTDGKIKIQRKHNPPNMTAISFILKNRIPEKWTEKPEVIPDFSKVDELINQITLLTNEK